MTKNLFLLSLKHLPFYLCFYCCASCFAQTYITLVGASNAASYSIPTNTVATFTYCSGNWININAGGKTVSVAPNNGSFVNLPAVSGPATITLASNPQSPQMCSFEVLPVKKTIVVAP